MIDLPATLKSCITTYWSISNPPLYSSSTMTSDIQGVIMKEDEYDPKSPALQICFETLPDRKFWIAPNFYKVMHRARITIFVKPKAYRSISADADMVETAKTTFTNMKTEIDRILNKYKFSMSGITNLINGGWNDRDTVAAGRGTKVRREPIQFRSINIVTAVYYVQTS